MSITTSIPSSTRKPGSFQEFDTVSGRRGLAPITRRVALIGAKTTAGTATVGVPKQLFSEADADALYGVGSELALMVKAAFKAARKAGKSPEIWAVALADAGGSAKATRTFTVTGPATAAGEVKFRIAGRPLVAPVANGDSANTVAAAMKVAVDKALANLPVTGGVATNVLTVTAVNGGPNGNDIKCIVDSAPAGIAVAVANGASGTGAYDITASLDTLADKTYHSMAIANHTSTDVTDLAAHIDDVGLPAVKRWSLGYIAETGTLSTANTLATTANKKEIIVITAEDFPNMPGEITAQIAVTVEAQEDPAMPFDGVELDLYLPPAASVPLNSEIESALSNGATPLTVNDELTQAKIVRLVTSKTTVNSVPFENLLDISNVRSLFYGATQVDTAWQIFQSVPRNKKKSAGAKKRLRSVTYDVLKKLEDLEIIQNVDAHAGELVVEDDPVVATRLNVAIPESVVPNLHQLCGVHTLIVE